MHNVKKSFKRLLAVSLCASCVLSNGMLSLAEGGRGQGGESGFGMSGDCKCPVQSKTVMI